LCARELVVTTENKANITLCIKFVLFLKYEKQYHEF